MEQFSLDGALGQVLVAGLEFVNQQTLLRRHAQPDLASGNGIDVQLRAVTGNEALEQLVGGFQVFLEFLPALFGVLTEYGQRALVFAGRQHLEIDFVLLQQTMHVRQLRHHADGAEDGKRCTENLLADAGHHVTAAGRYLVHADGQRDARIADTHQLRRSQAVAMHHAATTFQAQHHFVLGLGHGQQRRHLMAQVVGG